MTENFIRAYHKQIPDALCDKTIENFNKMDALGITRSRKQHPGVPKTQQDDTSYSTTEVFNANIHMPEFLTMTNLLWDAHSSYANEFDILNTGSGPYGVFNYKVQKTAIGQGYHEWHYEASRKESSQRLLFFIAYLNNVEHGGETEFLYYPKRVPATKGTVLISPCAFTHAHRGNPPLTGDKYVVTGWFEF